jgi:hypothetical protein
MSRQFPSCRQGQGNYCRRLFSQLCGVATCATLAYAGIVASGSEVFASATATMDIFIYNQNGVAQNMTDVDSYYDQHVYNALGNLIGTVDADDNILNSAGQTIGYVVSQ